MRLASRRRRLVAVAVALGLLAAVQSPTAPVGADATVVTSTSSGSSSARTRITLNRPAGTQAGHVMLASIVSNDDSPGFTAPNGWTPARQHTVKDTLLHTVYAKVAGPAEPASYTWEISSSRRLTGGITSFSGVDTAVPIDAVDGATNLSSTQVRAPGITTTVPNTLLVHLAAVAAEGTLSPPTGMTERWEAASPNRSSKRDALASLSQSVRAAAGPTGDRAATASRAGKSIGVLLALRPAVETTPPTATSSTTTTTTTGPSDTTPPDTTIGSGPSGTATSTFATFEFSATEPSSFLCQLDTHLPEECASPKTYANLADGEHTFAVVATDSAGNTDATPAIRNWTVAPGGEDAVFVGAGDIGYCGGANDEATARLLDDIPGQVFVLGDNTYPKGGDGKSVELSDFLECYGPNWGRHKDRTIPVVGNHEYVGPDADGYFSYFGAAAGDPSKGYYDVRIGAWHVIVLNSNCADVGGCAAGSPQEQWLRGVLARSEAECTIAMWHSPLYSSGATHGSDPAARPFWQALYDYGAEVVLNGHDHLYERFGFQTPTGATDAVYGLRQFTVGTGGRSSYGFATALPNSEVRGRPYGVLKLILRDQGYSWEFVPVAGQTFTDAGSSACHGAPATSPPLPPPPPPPPPGSGIGVVGSTSYGSSTARASITLSRPAGSAAGDVLVAAIATNADARIASASAGWTVVRDDVISGGVRQAVYVKVVGSTEPTSYQWTVPEGTRRIGGGITAYSGVDTTRPVDAVNVRMNGSSTAVAAPSITTSTANTMLVQLVTLNAEGTLTAPAGMTETWEAASPNTKAGNTRDVLMSSSQALQAAAGPTGNRIATAGQPGTSIGVLIALRPRPT